MLTRKASLSVLIAVIITMVAVGVQHKGIGENVYRLFPTGPIAFHQAFLSITNIVFAYAGHVAFFGFISELKDPKEFPKALIMLQVIEIALYLIVAVVVYYFGGQTVKSPALSTASPIIAKIAYGIAIPTIVIAGVIYAHVSAKYIFNRIFVNTVHKDRRTVTATVSWLSITLGLWIIAFIIAMSIPIFGDLLGIVSSLFASWFTYGISGVFWLFLNWGSITKSRRKMGASIAAWVLVVIGAIIMVVGMYSSIVSIKGTYQSGLDRPWTCGKKTN